MTTAPRRTLLLTATVYPPETISRLVRTDPEIRLHDYLSALSWYSAHLSPREWDITFVENSGADLAPLISAASLQGHSLHVVRSVPKPGGRQGKGNGEARMLDDAVRSIQERAGQGHQIVKATGRLIAKNLERAVPDSHERHIASRMHRDRSMADTRVLAADVDTWQAFFLGLDPLVDEDRGRYLEHAVALRTAEALYQSEAVWLPFRRELSVSGTSGTDGIRYDTPRARLMRAAKDLLGRVPQAEYR